MDFFDADLYSKQDVYQEMMSSFHKYGKGSSIVEYFDKELNKLNQKVPDFAEVIQAQEDIVYIPKEYC